MAECDISEGLASCKMHYNMVPGGA